MALNDKQQVFVEQYLTCWNATEAARRAEYAHPNVQGPRLLVNVSIQAAIAERLAELKMSADEVLTRLTEHARGSIAPFMRVSSDGELHGFDLGDDRPLNLLHKVSITKRRMKDVTEEKVTLELYDAQAALVHLGKHHSLFVERHEHSWKDTLKQQGHDPDAIKQQLVAAAIAALTSTDRRADERGDGGGTPADS